LRAFHETLFIYTSVQLEPIYSIRIDGDTDRRDEAKSLSTIFRKAPKKRACEARWANSEHN